MEIDVGDISEDEIDWNSTCTGSVLPTPPPAAGNQAKVYKRPSPEQSRVIMHFDLDCFYAQVEMIRKPALRNTPLGIRQKFTVVTCNYVARDLGVTKMMPVTAALEKCPQLVLVNGEDLTPYRETSYKVTELLMSYCPLVERLGLDENFVDITELVERRLGQETKSSEYSFKGHVYNHDSLDANAGCHPRLAIGSQIAAELREAIYEKLGLSGCAGIATNKLLAKLVSGTFKPNQQTTLLQESVNNFMSSLSCLRKLPGVGRQTVMRLQALGLVCVPDFQLFPLADLEKEFGFSTAQRLRNLSLGVDDTPVTPTGAPRSLSDEDSQLKMTSAEEVLHKVQDLLSSLIDRMYKDGRQPLTFRLAIRRYSTDKWHSRESRQCPIPNHIGQKITTGSRDGLAQLVSMGMKLFHKMVDTTAPFHLTLINVCFSNLQVKGTACGKGSITSFFTHKSLDKTRTPDTLNDLSQSGSTSIEQLGGSETSMEHRESGMECSWAEGTSDQNAQRILEPPTKLENETHWQSAATSTSQSLPDKFHICGTVGEKKANTPDSVRLPSNVDPEVFSFLPEDIQRELLSSTYPEAPHEPHVKNTLSTTVASSEQTQISPSNSPQLCVSPSQLAACKSTDTYNTLKDKVKALRDVEHPNMQTNENLMVLSDPQVPQRNLAEGTSMDQLSVSQSTAFPKDVDPGVFSELPPEVQRELMSGWKQQKPVLKMTTTTSKKQGKTSLSTERKASKGCQRNDLLKYFKPR